MGERQANVRAIPGVLFIEDFDEPAANPPSGASGDDIARSAMLPLAPEPIMDLDEIKRLAYEEGFLAGQKSAEDSMTARRCCLLSRIESLLEASRAAMCEAIESYLDLIAGSALQIISDCLPAFCERNGTDEMRALLRSTLALHAQEPNLVVAVNPAFEELAREETARLSGPIGAVSITADVGMPIGDVAVSWQTGAVRRETGRFRLQLLDRLHELGLLHQPERSSV